MRRPEVVRTGWKASWIIRFFWIPLCLSKAHHADLMRLSISAASLVLTFNVLFGIYLFFCALYNKVMNNSTSVFILVGHNFCVFLFSFSPILSDVVFISININCNSSKLLAITWLAFFKCFSLFSLINIPSLSQFKFLNRYCITLMKNLGLIEFPCLTPHPMAIVVEFFHVIVSPLVLLLYIDSSSAEYLWPNLHFCCTLSTSSLLNPLSYWKRVDIVICYIQ